MSQSPHVTVLGAGLAGTEAAWQIARAGVAVTLVEMRPIRRSPAHHSSDFAELVCSNSFGALSSDRAAGLLQEELRRLGSLVIGTADTHAVPAGGALAVDRGRYSAALTEALDQHPLVTIERREQQALPPEDAITVLATGPLTSEPLAEDLRQALAAAECEVEQSGQDGLQQEECVLLDRHVADRCEHAAGRVAPDLAIHQVVVPRRRVEEREDEDRGQPFERLARAEPGDGPSLSEREARNCRQDEREVELEVRHERALRTIRAAFRPLAPMMPPPG